MTHPKLSIAVVSVAMLALSVSTAAQETVPISELSAQSHIHDLAVDPSDPEYLLIATHHGLFRAGLDGMAEQLSETLDFMSFARHPADPLTLFASGHPVGGGNTGFIVSTDGGRSWEQRSPGANGPVDFHQMAISAANPDTMYGAFGVMQSSTDGGENWIVLGQLPEQLIDLAASAVDEDTIYAAAAGGLFVSSDRGATWRILLAGSPVSLVEVAPDGSIYVFVLGEGLMRASSEFEPLIRIESEWIDPYLLHLAVDPTDPDRMFALTRTGRIVASVDQGQSWRYLDRSG